MSEKLSNLIKLDELDDMLHETRVFLFYREMNGTVAYVARSDINLKRKSVRKGFEYARFKECKSVDDAYFWECRYYHLYIDTIEQKEHPAEPEGYGKGCAHCDYLYKDHEGRWMHKKN